MHLGNPSSGLPPLSPDNNSSLVHLSVDVPPSIDGNGWQVSSGIKSTCTGRTESHNQNNSRDDGTSLILVAFSRLLENDT